MSDSPTRDARDRLFVALDTGDADRALALARALVDEVGGFKIGLELFAAWGPAGIDALTALGARVFCDLKLHDIPNTVERAAGVLGAHGVELLTVHALGGAEMIARAVRGAGAGAARHGRRAPTVLAVTVLTSHDRASLAGLGLDEPVARVVGRLAAQACDAGAGGLVCSALEVAALRAAHPTATLVVPGIRPRGLAVSGDDQSRTAGPAEAVAAGADLLVVGRPIVGADDPPAAARLIVETLVRG